MVKLQKTGKNFRHNQDSIFLSIRCAAADAQRALWIANQGIDSVGAGARNGFTYIFTASNAQVSHQTPSLMLNQLQIELVKSPVTVNPGCDWGLP